MGLFKQRGKHVRSGNSADNATNAVESGFSSVNGGADQPQDADVIDGGSVEAPTVISPLEPSTSAADKPKDGLNKPERIDTPENDESAKSGSDESSNAETASEGSTVGVDSSSETQVIDPIPDTPSQASYQDREWSNQVDDSVYEAIPDSGAPVFKSADLAEITTKKKRRGLKVFGIAMGVFVILVCAVYAVGALVFMGRFLPNTVIGDYDVSMKSDEEVIEMLEDTAARYQIDVVGNGFSYRASGSDIGLSIDADGIVKAMHEDMNAWTWPVLITQVLHDESDQMSVLVKQSDYEAGVTDAVSKFNETATPPTNATIVYDDATSKFIVKKEEIGTQLDPKVVLESFGEAVDALQPKLVLDQDELLQPTVLSTDEKLNESAQLATGMVSAKLSLVMAGKVVGEVDGESLSQFVTIDENLDVTFKDEEMNAWVESLAAGFNTVGSARTYQRADGKEIRVEGGVYGWEVDTAALKESILAGIKAGSTSQIEVPCTDTAAAYNGVGQRDWGNRYIDVDISEQHVRFYGDDGAIIWESDCISGSPDGSHDTVPGVWSVNAKESPSKLIGYENGKKIYETTVTFWMPFEGNGIGFHDATWQPGFGGSMYANGYGSHGCVNLSYSAAQELYGIIQEGDVVVVHG